MREVLIFLTLLTLAWCQDSCSLQTSCDDCIQTFPECAWCADIDWEETRLPLFLYDLLALLNNQVYFQWLLATCHCHCW